MPKDDLEARFIKTMTEGQLLVRDQPVLLGVSGGADSVAMVDLFRALNSQAGWSLKLHIAHLNHRLRGSDASEDAAFVETLAKTHRLPFTIESVDISKRAEDESISTELAGRQCRLEFYERVCLAQGINTVALAHHADDNAETILHRIVRGTGLRGLVGIRPQREICKGSTIRLIHPLLAFGGQEIRQYLQDRRIEFRQDLSNQSKTYTRNRIRHEVIPLLREQFNPQIVEALNRLAEQARGLDEYLTETGERMLESLVIEHNVRQLVLHSQLLARKPRVIQTQLIRQAILRLGVGEGELTYSHLSAVADLAAEQAGSKALDLPAGLRVSRRYSRLVFEIAGNNSGQQEELAPAGEIRVTMEGTTILPVHGMEITVDIMPADKETIAAHISRAGPGSKVEEWLDAEKVHPPLIARSRRPGDRFFPLGMTGMKKLSDFFIDEKIDIELRKRAVVLCDQLGPIWIIPLRIDERVRLTRATRRVLRLSVRSTLG